MLLTSVIPIIAVYSCLLFIFFPDRIASFRLLSSKTNRREVLKATVLNEEQTKAKIPLKIAVAGAGVGGMFLGYTLQSKGFDVTVFEKSAR